MRYAPIETSSAIGGFIARQVVPLFISEVKAKAFGNLKSLYPTLSDEEANGIISRFLDNIGRLMAEFSIIDRMIDEDRVIFNGAAKALSLVGHEPLIAIGLHTGNWEMFSPAIKKIGVRSNAFYEPPQSPVQRKIAEKTRQRLGINLLSPDPRGVRHAIQYLRNNEVVWLTGDEVRAGNIMAPLFGRKPHRVGNLFLAARLARKTNAKIIISHCERLPRCHFTLHITEPFSLPDKAKSPLDDVKFLNDHIEPIIKANIHQWYYLDDTIGPVL